MNYDEKIESLKAEIEELEKAKAFREDMSNRIEQAGSFEQLHKNYLKEMKQAIQKEIIIGKVKYAPRYKSAARGIEWTVYISEGIWTPLISKKTKKEVLLELEDIIGSLQQLQKALEKGDPE